MVPGGRVSLQLLSHPHGSELQQGCQVCESLPRKNQTHLTCQLFILCVKLQRRLTGSRVKHELTQISLFFFMLQLVVWVFIAGPAVIDMFCTDAAVARENEVRSNGFVITRWHIVFPVIHSVPTNRLLPPLPPQPPMDSVCSSSLYFCRSPGWLDSYLLCKTRLCSLSTLRAYPSQNINPGWSFQVQACI